MCCCFPKFPKEVIPDVVKENNKALHQQLKHLSDQVDCMRVSLDHICGTDANINCKECVISQAAIRKLQDENDILQGSLSESRQEADRVKILLIQLYSGNSRSGSGEISNIMLNSTQQD